jgi:hypothetical protein
MHSLLTAFFALIFSFGHAEPARHTTPLVAPDADLTFYYAGAPSRHELEHMRVASSYAETACVSCQVTNVSYRTR